MSGPWAGGKGCVSRPFNRKKWNKNYDAIFGCKHNRCIPMFVQSARVAQEPIKNINRLRRCLDCGQLIDTGDQT